MSRGPGSVQQMVLDVLRERRGLLPWDELTDRFPRQARTHSLHRAVRNLKKRGCIRVMKTRSRRWIVSPYRPKDHQSVTTDREIAVLCDQITSSVRLLAQARGLPTSAVEEIAKGADVDTYKHLVFRGD